MAFEVSIPTRAPRWIQDESLSPPAETYGEVRCYADAECTVLTRVIPRKQLVARDAKPKGDTDDFLPVTVARSQDRRLDRGAGKRTGRALNPKSRAPIVTKRTRPQPLADRVSTASAGRSWFF